MDRPNRPVIHYTELRPDHPGASTEWATFVRELPGLLAEGHEGKHVLIKGDQIVGLWDNKDEAYREGVKRFPRQPIAVQLVAEWQPLLICGRYSRWVA